jgi:DNA-directed RNA polymerase subunit RPC12/RpoP
METKKCSNCGHEFPIKYFTTWVRKDGTIGVLHQCKHCQHKEANIRYLGKKKQGKLFYLKTEDMIEELERRGFVITKKTL